MAYKTWWMPDGTRIRSKYDLAAYHRLHPTKAEAALWPMLEPLGFLFQEIISGYIADFLHVKAKLVIEADGNIHRTTKAYDAKRTSHLEKHGYNVLRFENDAILKDPQAIQQLIMRRLTVLKLWRIIQSTPLDSRATLDNIAQRET